MSFKAFVGLEFIFSINARCGDKVVMYYLYPDIPQVASPATFTNDFSLHNSVIAILITTSA